MQLDQWRVSDGYFNTSGKWVVTDEDVRRRLHASIGGGSVPSGRGSSDPVGGSDRRAAGAAPGALDGPDLVPTWFVTQGEAAGLWHPARLMLEDGTELPSAESLPPDLPLGSHQLVPDDGGPTTNLFVVPARQSLPARSWGWSSQLYATRSHQSWGHGDLGDLATLASWSSSLGAGLVAHNPLGSSLPLPHQEPSPYFGSSRRYLSALYLNIEAIPGAGATGVNLDNLARAGRALNHSRLIDRDQVYALKMQALEQIWTALSDSEAGRNPRMVAALGDSDRDLTCHSVFCALAEAHGSGWSTWPARFSHPDSPAVEEFRRANSDRVAFWRWVHLELDEQLAAAANCGAGLMGDLAVGFDPDGSDAWADQDLLALDCRIGAPGDDFNPDGQDWGVTPYVPWKLRNDAYRPWLQTLRRVLRSCAGLRIDHVMGLSRLFWIPSGPSDFKLGSSPDAGPDGADSHSSPCERRSPGAYVYQFGTELLDLALMEAVRAGVWIAGEDLGTVEDGVRNAMATRGIFGYRVGWFEDTDPTTWPAETIGSLNTHDLATVAGVLAANDQSLEGSADENDLLLLGRLKRLAGRRDRPVTGSSSRPDPASTDQAAVDTAGDVTAVGDTADEVIVAAHTRLAAAGSAVVLASLDDAQAVAEQPNHPGTVDEFPNWRLALPVPIEHYGETLAPRIARAMVQNGRMHSPESTRPK